jgi:hypothetical protein
MREWAGKQIVLSAVATGGAARRIRRSDQEVMGAYRPAELVVKDASTLLAINFHF